MWWLKPVILATWDVEKKRIRVQGQPEQNIYETTPYLPIWAWWHVPVIPAT
jgi:hypothetical protein